MKDVMIFIIIVVALIVLLRIVQNICYTYCFVRNRKLELEHGIKENTMFNSTKSKRVNDSKNKSKWI